MCVILIRVVEALNYAYLNEQSDQEGGGALLAACRFHDGEDWLYRATGMEDDE
jgi:hypothetical protein